MKAINLITKHGFSICISCDSDSLISILDLGDQPFPQNMDCSTNNETT